MGYGKGLFLLLVAGLICIEASARLFKNGDRVLADGIEGVISGTLLTGEDRGQKLVEITRNGRSELLPLSEFKSVELIGGRSETSSSESSESISLPLQTSPPVTTASPASTPHHSFKVGDFVTAGEFEGYITKIDGKTIRVESKDPKHLRKDVISVAREYSPGELTLSPTASSRPESPKSAYSDPYPKQNTYNKAESYRPKKEYNGDYDNHAYTNISPKFVRPLSYTKVNQKYLDQCADEKQASVIAKENKLDENLKTLGEKAIKIFTEHKCTECHKAGSTTGSTKFTDILNSRELFDKKVVNFEEASKSILYKAVIGDDMPREDDNLFKAEQPKPLSEEEKSTILKWIQAKTPDSQGRIAAQAKDFDLGYVYPSDRALCIIKDLKRIPKEDRPYIRYFNLTAYYNSGDYEALSDQEVALNRLLNSLTFKEDIANVTKVDKLGTLLRIDLRNYKFSYDKWVHLEKRYDQRFGNENQHPNLRGAYELIHAQLPEIPADWFINIGQKELYSTLLGLPGKAEGKNAEREFKRLFYTDRDTYPEERLAVGLLEGESGVSAHNRIYRREPTVNPYRTKEDKDHVNGYYYASEDFNSSEPKDKKSITANPFDYVKNGGELIGSIPKRGKNGERMTAQAYFLVNDKGEFLNEVTADKNIVSHPRRAKQGFGVVNGHSCFDCHDRDHGIILPKTNTGGNSLGDHLRENLSAYFGQKVPLDLLVEFKPMKEITPLHLKDRSLYDKFVKETGGKPGVLFDTAQKFENGMSKKLVAATLGVPLEKFDEQLKYNHDLRRKLPFSTVGLIPRETFLNEFKDVVRILAKGGLIDVDVSDEHDRLHSGYLGTLAPGIVLNSKGDLKSRVEHGRRFYIWEVDKTDYLCEVIIPKPSGPGGESDKFSVKILQTMRYETIPVAEGRDMSHLKMAVWDAEITDADTKSAEKGFLYCAIDPAKKSAATIEGITQIPIGVALRPFEVKR